MEAKMSMRSRVALLCALLLPISLRADGVSTSGADLSLGDSQADVVAALGQPSGMLRQGGTTVLSFGARGTVTLRGGKVVELGIVSVREARARQEAREQASAERRLREQQAREANLAEGRRELALREQDEAFRERPAAERLVYWESFSEQYPGVPVADRIAALREEVAAAEQVSRAERLEALLAEEEATAARIEELSQTQGVSRQALRSIRLEIARLQEHLVDLRAQRVRLLEAQGQSGGE
jgi:hypothetical protein